MTLIEWKLISEISEEQKQHTDDIIVWIIDADGKEEWRNFLMWLPGYPSLTRGGEITHFAEITPPEAET